MGDTNQSLEAVPHFLISSSGGWPISHLAFENRVPRIRMGRIWVPPTSPWKQAPFGGPSSRSLTTSGGSGWEDSRRIGCQSQAQPGAWWQAVTGEHSGCPMVSWTVGKDDKRCYGMPWIQTYDCVSCQAHTHTFRWKNRCNPQVQMFVGDKIIFFCVQTMLLRECK